MLVYAYTDMTYVKADVPDETHKYIRMQAAEYGMTVEEVTKQMLVDQASNE